MNDAQSWYIVKRPAGNCEIVPQAANTEATEQWGPFESQQEAIARRVGLIRAGKCQPVWNQKDERNARLSSKSIWQIFNVPHRLYYRDLRQFFDLVLIKPYRIADRPAYRL